MVLPHQCGGQGHTWASLDAHAHRWLLLSSPCATACALDPGSTLTTAVDRSVSCSDRCLFAEVCSVPDGAVGCPLLPVPLCSHLALTCVGSLLSVPPRNSRSAEMAARSRMIEEAAALTHYSLTIRSLFAHCSLTIRSLFTHFLCSLPCRGILTHYSLTIHSLFVHYSLTTYCAHRALTIRSLFTHHSTHSAKCIRVALGLGALL